MNFSQKLGLFVLIVISVMYVYFSFFNKDFSMPNFNHKENQGNEIQQFNPTTNDENLNSDENNEVKPNFSEVKIFILDKNGNMRFVNRKCENTSTFECAMNELMKAPSPWEKNKGFFSEIPTTTKILSIRESKSEIMLDLSSNFEAGGGTDSTYTRVKQLIKTADANTNKPVYLFLNGKKVNVIGGDGIMIKQPLTEGSLDE